MSEVSAQTQEEYNPTTNEEWMPQPRESMLSVSHDMTGQFKHQKIEQLVDLFAVPDQVAPTFQRILFDRLVTNFKEKRDKFSTYQKYFFLFF